MEEWKKVLKYCEWHRNPPEPIPAKEEEKVLVGNQKKLDKNKNNKIDAEDFKILRKKQTK